MHSIELLALGALLAALVVEQASPQDVSVATVSVNVGQHWTDTGIDIVTRGPLKITAKGLVDVSLASRRLFGPNGDFACKGSLGTPLLAPGLPCWSLVGRVGNGGEIFFVGRASTIESHELGRLFLGVNDELIHFADNCGDWTVTISWGTLPPEAVAAPPDVLLSCANVLDALRDAFAGIPGSTIFARVSAREHWIGATPVPELPLPWGIVDMAMKAAGTANREATEAALREAIATLGDLAGPVYGTHAKAFIVHALLESLLEAEPMIQPLELSRLEKILNKTAREGLTGEVKELLHTERNVAFLAAACARPATTIRIGGPDDVLMIRYRGMDGASHLYDVLATWTEDVPVGRKQTAYGPVMIPHGGQGYARHQLAIASDPKAGTRVAAGASRPFYSADLAGLWPKDVSAFE